MIQQALRTWMRAYWTDAVTRVAFSKFFQKTVKYSAGRERFLGSVKLAHESSMAVL